jgi:hypothetical protein
MEYKISLGNIIKIKKGFLQGTFKIMYCGMSDENTFVLAPYVTSGYQGFSPNIYYPINTKLIQVLDIDFTVIKVTPEYIVFRE